MTSATQHPLPAELGVLLGRCTGSDSASDVSSLPPLRATKPFDISLRPVILALASTPIPVIGILHLLNDDLESAHTLVQADENNDDSNLIHSILHRREADFWNSKWWLDQFHHGFLDDLYSRRSANAGNGGRGDGRYGAKQFVDLVERVTTKPATTACAAKKDLETAKTWQAREHLALAQYLFQKYGLVLST
ncbi:hypothetical protein BCV70DRAFT_44610 [Testicularia cyperi]|uniref:Uncharacterized protein n=1 Tax=Testicularia cyperi TaxID=1882483 RepID=A0A317XIQ7_9BASI|nr:hypothetical protein BCV70DRAFT_44610 [Testicularia cyperi]